MMTWDDERKARDAESDELRHKLMMVAEDVTSGRAYVRRVQHSYINNRDVVTVECVKVKMQPIKITLDIDIKP